MVRLADRLQRDRPHAAPQHLQVDAPRFKWGSCPETPSNRSRLSSNRRGCQAVLQALSYYQHLIRSISFLKGGPAGGRKMSGRREGECSIAPVLSCMSLVTHVGLSIG